ncbi:MAG: hypothetical protein ACLQVF_18670 [Isosphaeraceae bacterium]
MGGVGCVLGLLVFLQVPPPSPTDQNARELEAARRWVLARETTALEGVAEELTRLDKPEGAGQIHKLLLTAASPDGPTRFMPLPEVVGHGGKLPAGGDGLPGPKKQPEQRSLALDAPWQAKVDTIRSQAASKLCEVAQRGAKSDPPRYSLASVCLRSVLERQPDHPEARRLLGYVRHGDGWARPFAVRQLKDGKVNHPTFGWVPSDWLPHLERGELPAPRRRGQREDRWLSAADADRLRADWDQRWQIATEHFTLLTNVPLAEAIHFGRRLEAFHDLFTTLLADILGDKLPLVRRFRDPAMTGEPEYRPHVVYYFASKAEYVDYFRNRAGAAARELGYYDPPKSERGRVPAYFFRDPEGELPVEANLYHEVSHQLLFETAPSNAYTKNVGNYWVFEGLGTYFETVSPQDDGSLEVGGMVGRRIEAALSSLVDQKRKFPLAEFIALGEPAFKRDSPRIVLYYQQAMVLTVFLMQWRAGTYRDAFLDYVHDAYRGRIKRTTGRSLQDRLGQPYETLDRQFLTFLESARARAARGESSPAKSQSGGIRTVPNP